MAASCCSGKLRNFFLIFALRALATLSKVFFFFFFCFPAELRNFEFFSHFVYCLFLLSYRIEKFFSIFSLLCFGSCVYFIVPSCWSGFLSQSGQYACIVVSGRCCCNINTINKDSAVKFSPFALIALANCTPSLSSS